jgi:hypothetical protein
VRKKYLDDFSKTKDLHFFLGTSQVHHFTGKNPFLIIGTFHPKPYNSVKFILKGLGFTEVLVTSNNAIFTPNGNNL